MDTQPNNTPEEAVPQTTTAAPDNKKVMSILAYIGPLVIVSFIIAKEDPHVKFHIKQGGVLFAIEILAWLLGMIFFVLAPLLLIVNLATLVLSIVGIVHAVNGAEKELPIVGPYARYIKF